MLDEIIELDKKYYMNTFGDRLPVCFTEITGGAFNRLQLSQLSSIGTAQSWVYVTEY